MSSRILLNYFAIKCHAVSIRHRHLILSSRPGKEKDKNLSAGRKKPHLQNEGKKSKNRAYMSINTMRLPVSCLRNMISIIFYTRAIIHMYKHIKKKSISICFLSDAIIKTGNANKWLQNGKIKRNKNF